MLYPVLVYGQGETVVVSFSTTLVMGMTTVLVERVCSLSLSHNGSGEVGYDLVSIIMCETGDVARSGAYRVCRWSPSKQ